MTGDPVSLTFLGYILVMLGVGYMAWRRTRTMGDYLLGGRWLGRFSTALSAEASDMSGWLLMGLPGYAYVAGLESLWLAAGLLAGTWLNWRFMAPALRLASGGECDALTIPELLAGRHPGRGRSLRILSALFILFFFTIYTASGLVAGGKLFAASFGWDYRSAVLGAMTVIMLYTLFGGFLAVVWTDVIQGLMMGAALVVVPALLLQHFGGWPQLATSIAHIDADLLDPWTNRQGEALGLMAIASLLAWGLGYFGQPHILARFMAIREARDFPAARRIAIGWVSITLGDAVLVGLGAVAYLDPPLPQGEQEKVFIHLVQQLFNPWLAGFLLAAILAAIMSTADSQLLVASSALAEDLLQALRGSDSSHHARLWLGRSAVLVIAVISTLLALDPDSQVLDLVAYAWAGFGASFGPVLLLSLYSRLSATAALAGLLGGGATVVVWHHLQGGWFELYEIIPGFAVSTAIMLVTNRFVPDQRNSHGRQ